jgi:hypothetical protein
VLATGQPLPDVAVWTSTNERIPMRNLAAGRKTLFLFYLFDWSST